MIAAVSLLAGCGSRDAGSAGASAAATEEAATESAAAGGEREEEGERNQILENFRFVWKSTGQLEQMALLYIVF